MLYVTDPKKSADFWVEKLGFKRGHQVDYEGKLLSVELIPYEHADAYLVVLDRAIVEQISDLEALGIPSILFTSNDVVAMREQLAASGVEVGAFVEVEGRMTFNFCDNDNHWFAVEQAMQ
ncbi:MAG: VOC family protein [Erysipelotrichaceae bacterium]